MPLFISNDEQAQCIAVPEAIDVMADAFRQCARGDAVRRPRIDNFLPTSRPDEFFCFSSMEGGIRSPGFYALRVKPDIIMHRDVNGLKRRMTYSGRPGRFAGLVFLYSVERAELLAIMNDGYVQHVRVAATGGLGMRYLARNDCRVMGILGSGGMARMFAVAACAERPIELIKVWSPNRVHLDACCADIQSTVSARVVAADEAEAMAADCDILSSCTNSVEPVVDPSWIRPGLHVTNCAGRELGVEARRRIDVAGTLVRRTPLSVSGFIDDDFEVLGDNVMSYAGGQPDEKARIPREARGTDWYPRARIVDCYDWDRDEPYRRGRDEVTTLVNASLGVIEGESASSAALQGVQFAATAGRIYERAVALGLGTPLPDAMFTQDIAT
jgi:ornithine cyclodeaminase/alanine dehydrogenase-like protein (mu-crystallin family)